MLNKIRDSVRPWIVRAARPFADAGLDPNHITVIALIVGICGGVLFSLNEPRWAAVVILMGGFFDVIDGAVARLTGRVSKMGGILDSACDRITDAALYVGVMAGGMGSISGEPSWLLPVLALIGSFLVSYVRARAEAAGSGELDIGVAERAERLIILAIGALIGLIPHALVLIVVLTSLTVVQRIWAAHNKLSSPLDVFK